MKISKQLARIEMVPKINVDFHGTNISIPNYYIYGEFVYVAMDADGTINLYSDLPTVVEGYGPKEACLGEHFTCETHFSEVKEYLYLTTLPEKEMENFPDWRDSCIQVEIVK